MLLNSTESDNILYNLKDWKLYLHNSIPTVLSFVLDVIIAVLVLFIGGKIIKWILKILRKALDKSKADDGVTSFVCSLVKWLLYAVLIMIILSQFGLTTGSVVAVLGSLGLTLGLSLQGSLSNFAGGVLILLLKPFVVGDYIIENASGLEGTVKEITIFYTKLTTFDNREVSVPNGNLSNSSIVNVTKNPKRRVDVSVSVAYSTDLKHAKTVLLETAKAMPNLLPEEPIDVFASEFEESGIMMKVRIWVKTEDYWESKWALTEAVKEAFDRENIIIPFPQMDIFIKQSKN